ncbi:hypothetical protein [Nonomuraea sp. NPDC048826]|uniref:hypothetical protein n=1 Tax=Nonomuraea sp. NPDC048826 TaxID=3364347 RepID=UPI0037141F6C
MRTEEELTTALREGASGAPDMDLLAGVARLRSRRTRRRATALAAAAVITVIAGTAVARGSGPDSKDGLRPAATTMVTMTPATEQEPLRPAATTTVTITPATEQEPLSPDQATVTELWPQALFTMPAANADGWRYRPVTALNATEVLLAAESSFEKAGTFEIYDSKTRTTRVVTRVPQGEGLKKYFPQSATVGPDDVAWSGIGQRPDGTRVREIWTAPLAGGEARLLVTRTGRDADVDAIAIGDGHVLWSESGGGVWRVPLTGGEPERVPGGDDLHLIAWPWASDVAKGPEAIERNQTRLVNLADGTTRVTAAPPGVRGWRCGPVWCHGHDDDGGLLIHRADGTDPPRLRKTGAPGMHAYPALDRFLVSSGVYDLASDKLGRLDGSGSWYGRGTSSEPTTVLYWGTTPDDKPDEYRVLNLAAVPPAQ